MAVGAIGVTERVLDKTVLVTAGATCRVAVTEMRHTFPCTTVLYNSGMAEMTCVGLDASDHAAVGDTVSMLELETMGGATDTTSLSLTMKVTTLCSLHGTQPTVDHMRPLCVSSHAA
mmetsp:Transcript_116288/g.173737  ORF Transcript_116288/g.173737 Transcript_116288/m.173737 type:complete len:117 (+) Transcript_116288:986-1336(+)